MGISKEAKAAYDKIYREKNKEKLKIKKAAYQKANKDKHNEACRKWSKANRHKTSYYWATRRAIKLQRTPKWLTEKQKSHIKAYYETATILSNYLGIKLHVDHIIPLQGEIISGLHVPENLQLMVASANCSKGNSYGEY
jgi:hypothetical protein